MDLFSALSRTCTTLKSVLGMQSQIQMELTHTGFISHVLLSFVYLFFVFLFSLLLFGWWDRVGAASNYIKLDSAS